MRRIVASLTTYSLVVNRIPRHIFHETINTGLLITLRTTESQMLAVCFFRTDESSIARSITAILAVVREFVRIEALSDSGMGIFISHLGRYTTIESIEIPKPISVIIFIHILDHSTLN